jgi:hypothetical protein
MQRAEIYFLKGAELHFFKGAKVQRSQSSPRVNIKKAEVFDYKNASKVLFRHRWRASKLSTKPAKKITLLLKNIECQIFLGNVHIGAIRMRFKKLDRKSIQL